MAGGPAPGKLVWCTREEHDRRHGPPWWAMLRRPGAVRARDPAGRLAPARCATSPDRAPDADADRRALRDRGCAAGRPPRPL